MLNERLKKIRKENNETQQEMADNLNVSQRTVANWEAGDRMPSYDVLIKIADKYNVSTDYLLGRTDVPMYEHMWKNKDGSKSVLFSATEKNPPTPERRKELEEQASKNDAAKVVIHEKDLPTDRKELEQFVLDVLRKQQGKN